jgi:hypothetical protein
MVHSASSEILQELRAEREVPSTLVIWFPLKNKGTKAIIFAFN